MIFKRGASLVIVAALLAALAPARASPAVCVGLSPIAASSPVLRMSLGNYTIAVGDTVAFYTSLYRSGDPSQGLYPYVTPFQGQTVYIVLNPGLNCSYWGTPIGNSTTDSYGDASFAFQANLTPGEYTVVAWFGGNGSWSAAYDQALLIVVNFTTALSTNVPSSAYEGDSLTLSAVLTDSAKAPVSSAIVAFFVEGQRVGESLTGGDGRASVVYTSSTVGELDVIATFDGEGFEYGASSSPLAILNVGLRWHPTLKAPIDPFPEFLVLVTLLAAVLLAAWAYNRRSKPTP